MWLVFAVAACTREPRPPDPPAPPGDSSPLDVSTPPARDSAPPPDPPPGTDPPPAPRCTDDVPGRFAALEQVIPAERFPSAGNDGVLPWPRYTDSIDNSFGFLEHFQGIQRVGRHLFVSAGVAYGERTSQLLVVEMGARSLTDRWSPAGTTFVPDPADRFVAAIDLDPVLWHGGGLQIADGVAAIPLAGDEPAEAGEVRFYDVTDPLAPRELAVRLARARKLYVAALTRTDDGRWLVLAWDDELLELQRSVSADLEDGLEEPPATIRPADVVGGFQEGGCGLGCGTYQALNFVRDCGGQQFLVATRNSEKLSPTVPGDNLASLYAFDWSGAQPSLAFVDRREFECDDRQCNFAAAAGVEVAEDGDLRLYGAYHWLQEDGTRLRFDEFTAP